MTSAKFDIGWVIEKGFGTFFKHLPAFLLMGALVYSPLLVFAAYAKYPLADTTGPFDAFGKLYGFLGVLMAGTMLLQPLLSGMVTFTVVESLSGRQAGFARAVGVGFRRLLPSFLVGLLVAVLVLLGTIALIIPGFLLALALYVSVPASVIERPGIFGALGQSMALTKGSRGWVFALTMMVGAVPGVLSAVFDLVIVKRTEVHGVMMVAPEGWPTYVWAHVILTMVGGTIGSALCATTYVHLRNIKDGVPATALATVFE